MRPVVKKMINELDGLGFQWAPHPTKEGGRVYTHGNDSSREVKVYTKGQQMSESYIRLRLKEAHKIADLGTSGPRDAETLAQVAKVKRADKKAEREREAKAREERAQAKEVEFIKRRVAEETARKRREIESLMKPGYGR